MFTFLIRNNLRIDTKFEGFSPVPGILLYGDYPPFDPFGAGSSISRTSSGLQ